MKQRKRKNKIKNIYLVIFTIITLIFLTILKISNLLPTLYYIIILIGVIIIYLPILILIKKRKKLGYISSSILMLILIIITYYLGTTLTFFNSFSKIHYNEETYLVLALKEKDYKDIKDLENTKLGYIQNNLTNINKALEKLDKKIETTKEEYQDYTNLFNDLDNQNISSILLEENYYNIKSEEEDITKYQIIYKITIKSIIKEDNKNVDVTKKPFTIYISGIDVYGDIETVSRSDVNILVTINPNTKQILLTSIPRDYYVQLSNTTGYKDKLTHVGNYGINMSINTIEDLLDIDINYYLRVNFTTLEKLIDSLNGVDVYSEYTFISYIDNYKFYKGYNHMNGKQALAFSRERKSLPNGDNDRGKNQEAVIEAIIRKGTSKEIIYKYTKILNNIKGTFQTNLSDSDITKLIQKELQNPGGWNITSTSLTGTGSMEYTYSYSTQKLYVTIPDSNSITIAKDLINKVNTDALLESSYTNEINNIKYPDQITPITPKEEDNKEESEEEQTTTKEENKEIPNEESNKDNEEETIDTPDTPKDNEEPEDIDKEINQNTNNEENEETEEAD